MVALLGCTRTASWGRAVGTCWAVSLLDGRRCGPARCRMSSGARRLDARSTLLTPCPRVWQPKLSSNCARCPLGGWSIPMKGLDHIYLQQLRAVLLPRMRGSPKSCRRENSPWWDAGWVFIAFPQICSYERACPGSALLNSSFHIGSERGRPVFQLCRWYKGRTHKRGTDTGRRDQDSDGFPWPWGASESWLLTELGIGLNNSASLKCW